MRQFYRTFPIRQTLSSELSWSHYSLLMRIEDDKSRKFYASECRGFSFVSRQQKITFDGRHFFIDLVFYNYMLKCFVIIVKYLLQSINYIYQPKKNLRKN